MINTKEKKPIKIVIMGDEKVGKTSLIMSYLTNSFENEYYPTPFNNYSVIVNAGNRAINLTLCDISGAEEYNTLRSLLFNQVDIFLICFSHSNTNSLQNISFKWIPEITTNAPNIPFIIVSTKCDLNIKGIDDDKYIQCSSLSQRGVNEVINNCIETVLLLRKKRRMKLCKLF